MTGPELTATRKRYGLSQAALGALLGADGTQVSRWERGAGIGPEYARKLAAFVAGELLPEEDVRMALRRIESKLDQLLSRTETA